MTALRVTALIVGAVLMAFGIGLFSVPAGVVAIGLFVIAGAVLSYEVGR